MSTEHGGISPRIWALVGKWLRERDSAGAKRNRQASLVSSVSGDDIAVTLVDGVGRPRILYIEHTEIMPNVIRFPHQGVDKDKAQVIVHFDRSNKERDAHGRQVYRQRGTGMPPLRDAYFILPEKA